MARATQATSPAASSTPAPSPPGPRRLVPHLLAFFRAPRECYQALQRRYGDPFSVPSPLGGRMSVSACPAHVQKAFALSASDTTTVDKAAGLFYGPGSITVLEGEAHTRMRRLLNAPLISGRREAAAIMREATLRQTAGLRTGERITADSLCRPITLEIILRTVFGASEGGEIERLRTALLELRDTMNVWLVFIPALRRRLGRWSPWSRFQDAIARVDAVLMPMIATARAEEGAEGRGDLLTHLARAREPSGEVSLTDAAIRDNLLTLLFAGHESTANALSWALYWVHCEPGVLDRLLAELGELGDAPEMAEFAATPYLNAVCREALRIEPVAPGVARRLTVPLTLGRHEVPAGDIVMLSIDLAHGDPERYPEPERFRPERFLDRTPNSSAFFPFGGGRRHCLGAVMALQEMRVVLATLLTRWRFGLEEPKPVRRVWKTGIMAPRGGIRLRVEGPLRPAG